MPYSSQSGTKNEADQCAASAAILEFSSVSVSYVARDNVKVAVEQVSFVVPEGGFVSLVGPSGCGKSTLLHVAAGLLLPSEGSVRYLGQRWEGLHPDVAYVTQRDTLLPWRNIVANIALPLALKGVGKSERREQARDMAEHLGLGDCLKMFPNQLSGGMRQRVQLGRTLISRPKLLLMDEPFGALDAHLRLKMQELLLGVLAEHRVSTLFVTHDLSEAIALSDVVVAMKGSPGRIGLTRVIEGLPDRRDLMALRADPRFNEYQGDLWKTISA
jgi:sulfonate transport system ATP-binding protein